jgi:Ca2+-binding EF-hand superfamily protein
MADIKRLIKDRPEDVKTMAKAIFDEIDLDKSGEIDRDEMREILKTMAI